jgi:hypothetical protein
MTAERGEVLLPLLAKTDSQLSRNQRQSQEGIRMFPVNVPQWSRQQYSKRAGPQA